VKTEKAMQSSVPVGGAGPVSTGVVIRVHGSPTLPALIYLPGLHGDWTLVASFRSAIAGKVRFVEITYPRTRAWSLNDYAAGIEQALLAQGVAKGWLIGESFGSQPAWQIIQRSSERNKARAPGNQSPSPRADSGSEPGFQPLGLILAGGFVKHPWPWGVKCLRYLNRRIPRAVMRELLRAYATYARFRHRQAADTLANIAEFVVNRQHPDDPGAMDLRYTLIAESDLRPTAEACRLPVFHLAGLVDPIVPGGVVRRWLKANSPGYRGGITLLRADHNVLGTAPVQSANLVLEWIGSVEPEKCAYGL
jgi:pimeloyl-ACP methyl ester carboxylesterase